MVKGTSRQVIVVNSPDPKLFEQAIFILKDTATRSGITDEVLMREAQKLIRSGKHPVSKHNIYRYGLFWSCCGAAFMGIIWTICELV